MIKKSFLVFFAFLTISNSHAFDIKLLANNKEISSKELLSEDEVLIEDWLKDHPSRELMFERSKATLATAMSEFHLRPAYCDIGLANLLKEKALSDGLIKKKDEFKAFASYLRKVNHIDDIFYRNIISSYDITAKIEVNHFEGYAFPPINKYTEDTEQYDLEKLYRNFKDQPDELNTCSIESYIQLSYQLQWKNERARNRLLKRLDYQAYEQGYISKETYNILNIIRRNDVWSWPVHVNSYLSIVLNAKDKLSLSGIPEVDPSPYSMKYIKRREKLNHRERLYHYYSSTQIMMLAEIIQKTAKRIDAKNVSIHFEYGVAESEIYVLSPMEKYRLSLKMLRKDMAELSRSDLFRGAAIEYEDIVTAAYETGLIKSDELDLILKFEDFWNPKNPKWKTYSNFTFSILGSASFFLPPPWNIVGALGLIVTQSKIHKSKRNPQPEDNWNVVI